MPRKFKSSDRGVLINVHSKFFDGIFEPQRKNLERQLGVGLTQKQFTEYLVKSNAKISFNKPRTTFAPRRSRRGGLGFI